MSDLTPDDKNKLMGYFKDDRPDVAHMSTQAENFGKSMLGMGQFPDTGREATPAESIDSLVGAPLRRFFDEFAARNNQANPRDMFDFSEFPATLASALRAAAGQVGKDPSKAPTGFDVVNRLPIENPYLSAAVASFIDMAQVPGTGALMPGVIGEIKGVKDLGKVADAVEAFAKRGKVTSTENKIAQMHGQTGEVSDAMPQLLREAESDWRAAQKGKEFVKERGSGQAPDLSEYGFQRRSAYDNPRNAPPQYEEFSIPKSGKEEYDEWVKTNPDVVSADDPYGDLIGTPSDPNRNFTINDHVWTPEKYNEMYKKFGEGLTERLEISPEDARRVDQWASKHRIGPYEGLGPYEHPLHTNKTANRVAAEAREKFVQRRWETSKRYADEKKHFPWRDDQSFTDEAKEALDSIASRYGEPGSDTAKGPHKALRNAQNTEAHHLPYVGQEYHAVPNMPIPFPNFAAKPTGVIGEPRIQTMNANQADPFSWMDAKYGAAKQLLRRHGSQGMPVEIHTSSDLISKPDYMSLIPQGSTVNLHMLSDNESINRVIYPANASQKRMELAAEKLEQAGIKVNRIYPDFDKFINDSYKAYPSRTEKDIKQITGYDDLEALREAMKPDFKPPRPKIIKPDNMAHGGMVTPQMMAGGGTVGGAGDAIDQWIAAQSGGVQATQGLEGDRIDQWISAREQDEKRSRFDNTSGEIAAGITGLASGATLGLSNVLLTKLGVTSPESLKILQETNPASYMAGELASAFLPTGAASVIGKAGKATYEGLKALKFIKNADKISKSTKLFSQVAAQAAGSAVEGSLYAGVSQSLNEFALGDTDLNAEKVLSNFGMGALFGGALGGTLKAASIGVPPSLKMARDGLAKTYKVLFGDGHGDDSVVSGLLEKIAPENQTLLNAWNNRAAQYGDDVRKTWVNDVSGVLNDTKNNIMRTVKDLNAKIRPEELKTLIETVDRKKVGISTQNVINKINTLRTEMINNPGLYDANAAAKLDKWHTQITNNLKSNSMVERFNLLKDVKQGIGNWGWGIAKGPSHDDTRAVLKDLSKSIGEILKDPDVFGFAGSSYAAHDEMLSHLFKFFKREGGGAKPSAQLFKDRFLDKNWNFSSKKIEKLFKNQDSPEALEAIAQLEEWFSFTKTLPDHLENTYANIPTKMWDQAGLGQLRGSLEKDAGDFYRTMGKYGEALDREKGSKLGMKEILLGGITASHPALGGLALAADVAGRPIEYINKLSNLERFLNKSTQTIERGAKRVFTPTLKGLGKAKGPMTRELLNEEKESYKKTRDDLSQMMGNPEVLMEKLNAASDGIYQVAPTMTESMQMGLINAAQMLHQKMPQASQNSPFEAEYEPSLTEITKFRRFQNIVEDPYSVFDQIHSNTITPESVETLQMIYPRLLDEMRSAVLEQAARRVAKKEVIPFQLRQSLSLFLGSPLDQMTSGQGVLANQMAYQPMEAPQAPAPKVRASAKMSVAERTKTGLKADSTESA